MYNSKKIQLHVNVRGNKDCLSWDVCAFLCDYEIVEFLWYYCPEMHARPPAISRKVFDSKKRNVEFYLNRERDKDLNEVEGEVVYRRAAGDDVHSSFNFPSCCRTTLRI